jgi:hypothetical protein
VVCASAVILLRGGRDAGKPNGHPEASRAESSELIVCGKKKKEEGPGDTGLLEQLTDGFNGSDKLITWLSICAPITSS